MNSKENKDNPVPSLDNNLINILNKFLGDLSENNDKEYVSSWSSEIEYAEKLLQNGVETEKN